MIDYSQIADLAADEPGGLRFLSPETVTMLNTAVAGYLGYRDGWEEGDLPLDDTQWDSVDEWVSRALLELNTFVNLQPAILKDKKPLGNIGGIAEAGAWQLRTLNTLEGNLFLGVTLASNQFVLPSGRWLIKFSAPAFGVNRHQCRLFETTGNSVLAVGSSELASSGALTTNRSFGVWSALINDEITVQLEHRVQTTRASTGFGVEASFLEEVYSQVEVYKVE